MNSCQKCGKSIGRGSLCEECSKPASDERADELARQTLFTHWHHWWSRIRKWDKVEKEAACKDLAKKFEAFSQQATVDALRGLVSFEYQHKAKCPKGPECNCGLGKLLTKLNTNYEHILVEAVPQAVADALRTPRELAVKLAKRMREAPAYDPDLGPEDFADEVEDLGQAQDHPDNVELEYPVPYPGAYSNEKKYADTQEAALESPLWFVQQGIVYLREVATWFRKDGKESLATACENYANHLREGIAEPGAAQPVPEVHTQEWLDGYAKAMSERQAHDAEQRGLALRQAAELCRERQQWEELAYDNEKESYELKNRHGHASKVYGMAATRILALDPSAIAAQRTHDADEYAKGYIAGGRDHAEALKPAQEQREREIRLRAIEDAFNCFQTYSFEKGMQNLEQLHAELSAPASG